jgi:hypothetical protein
MLTTNTEPVVVPIPAELAARMEALKNKREEDRDKSLEDLVVAMCRSYVRVREMAEEEANRMEALEESYRSRPFDFPDDLPQEGDTLQFALI